MNVRLTASMAMMTVAMSIVVRQGSKTLVSRGYGVADVSNNRPMSDTTAFRIGLITKMFTAIATMKLVEQGRIDLDAPLSRYRPDIAASKSS